MSNPIIIIDTREQLPYSFPSSWPTVRQSLTTGDYSLLGFEDCVALERKSLDDLLGCIFTDRFEAELKRGAAIAHGYLIIEANLYRLRNHRRCKGEKATIKPQSVLGKLQAYAVRYGWHVLWLDSREEAEAYAVGLLGKLYKHLAEATIA